MAVCVEYIKIIVGNVCLKNRTNIRILIKKIVNRKIRKIKKTEKMIEIIFKYKNLW